MKVYVPTMFGPVYATTDAGGRLHVCPASWRLATDPEFRERVAARTAARKAPMIPTHRMRFVAREERA